jgi:hypothetical protein
MPYAGLLIAALFTLPANDAAQAATDPGVAATDVTRFGAKGDGIADDSAAIRRAIRAASDPGSSKARRIHFPAGRYRIESDALISDTAAKVVNGSISFTGDGWDATELILVAGTTPKWFYNNGSVPRMQFVTFRDLKFTGSGPSANGFHLWSAGHEQGFRFTNCWFYNLVNAFELEGTGNDSEMYFFGCRFDTITGAVYIVNNQQSVAHGFYGCDFIPIHGDIFRIGPHGGGDINVFGGSAVMRPPTGKTSAVPHYLISIPDSEKVGPGNGNYSFFGLRVEFHTPESRIVNLPAMNGAVRVSFHGCDFATTTGGAREGAVVNLRKTVIFDGGTVVSSDFTFRVATPASVRGVHQNQGEILFLNSLVAGNLYELVTLDAMAGHVRAEGCSALRSTQGVRRAIDFDMGWASTGLGQSFHPKSVAMLGTTDSFPFGGGHESTVLLPPNAVIRAVFAYKSACGSGKEGYQLFIGTDDKKTVYAKSGTNPESGELRLHSDGLLMNSGTAAATRTIRVWATGGTYACTGGYAFVEYY